jgi:hypothetical protein
MEDHARMRARCEEPAPMHVCAPSKRVRVAMGRCARARSRLFMRAYVRAAVGVCGGARARVLDRGYDVHAQHMHVHVLVHGHGRV